MPDLSNAQFGAPPAITMGVARPLTEYSPPTHGTQVGKSQPTYYADIEPPLPHAEWSNSSPKRAAAWRKPHHVLPYNAATNTSKFSPFG